MIDLEKKEILLSWERCYKKGVEKDIKKIKKRVNKVELKQRIKRNKNLIKVFNNSVKKLLKRYTVKNTVFFINR